MSPILEDYARTVISDRIQQAQRDALADLATHRGIPYDPRARLLPSQPFASSARLRLADGLRSLARRLDPCAPVESQLLIARSR